MIDIGSLPCYYEEVLTKFNKKAVSHLNIVVGVRKTE